MSGKINCIVVDDDKGFLTVMKAYIQKTEFLELKGLYYNPWDAIEFLNARPMELLFLDIQMPGMNGLELLKSLAYSPQVVLISSSREHAISAFEMDVADYILKEQNDYVRFLTATNRAIKRINIAGKKKEEGHIFTKIDKLIVKINFKDILFIEAYGDYIKIHTKDKVYLKLSSLKSIQETLPEDKFIKTHRSFIINLNSIEVIDGHVIRFGNKIVPVSKQYRDIFFRQIKIDV